jgi:hypothetical protein
LAPTPPHPVDGASPCIGSSSAIPGVDVGDGLAPPCVATAAGAGWFEPSVEGCHESVVGSVAVPPCDDTHCLDEQIGVG